MSIFEEIQSRLSDHSVNFEIKRHLDKFEELNTEESSRIQENRTQPNPVKRSFKELVKENFDFYIKKLGRVNKSLLILLNSYFY